MPPNWLSTVLLKRRALIFWLLSLTRTLLFEGRSRSRERSYLTVAPTHAYAPKRNILDFALFIMGLYCNLPILEARGILVA